MTKKRKKKSSVDPLASVPPETRLEIERHLAALTEQLEAARAEVEPWKALKPFVEQAREAGRTLPEVLQDFVATEHYLRERPVEAMFELCEKLGLDPRETAHALVQIGEGEAPRVPAFDERKFAPAIETRLHEIERERDALDAVEEFKRDPPRFAELEPVIAGLLEKKLANDLPDAYAKAEQLKPAPPNPGITAHNKAAQTRNNNPAVHPAPTPDPAQTRKAKLSITGAPPSGSDPATRKVPATTRDAVEKAFAQLGL